MRKCHTDEVPTLMGSLAAQCADGIQFNWVHYLCKEFLMDYKELEDQRNTFHYAWMLMSIVLVVWDLL